jgi:myo-inositol catabolism protein IolC
MSATTAPSLGYRRPLYLLAFDHRGSFEHDLFHASAPLSDRARAGIVDAKNLIFEAFGQAVERGAPRVAAGVLVDEEFGSAVARRAKAAGHVLAMPVERSGQAEFDFAYGDDFGAHIERFDPTFAKVLVRYNPAGDRELNARQAARLARLARWLHDRDRKFLFELLVPPLPEQLARCGGDPRRFDRELRPDLVVETIRSLQAAGVEPDVWKIEGLDAAEDNARVVAQARTGGRDGVSCIVLGRDAPLSQVLRWLRTAAGVPGFDGFAVGRTLWEEALRRFLAGEAGRDEAVRTIADRYLEMVEGFAAARRPRAHAGAEQHR